MQKKHHLLRLTKQRSDIHTHNPTQPAPSDQAKIRHSYTQPNTASSVKPSKDQTFIHTTQHHRQQTLSPSVSSDQARIRHYPYTQPNTTGNKHSVLLFRQTKQGSDIIHTHNPTPQATNTQSFCFVRPTSNASDHAHNPTPPTLSPVSSDQPVIPLKTHTAKHNTANAQSFFVKSTSNTSDHTHNPTPPTLSLCFVSSTSNTSHHTHNQTPPTLRFSFVRPTSNTSDYSHN